MGVTDQYDYTKVSYTACFCAGRVPGRACYGAITHEHIVPRQRIKLHVKPVSGQQVRALRDRRNIVGVCLGCHLGTLTTGNPLAQVQPSDLPAGFWDFIEQYNLWAALPRHLMGACPDKATAE